MSAGVIFGRRRDRVPSDMEAMLWFRTRRDCRARPSARGAGSSKRAALRAVEFAVRGAGRPGIKQCQPGIKQALEKLVDPVTPRGPAVAVEVDVQESGEARRGAVECGLAGEHDDGGSIAA